MNPLQEFQKRPRVLTVGGGLTALEAASQLIQFGYEVLLACPEMDMEKINSLLQADRELPDYARDLAERLGAHGKFSFFPETQVNAVDGFAGDFQVRLTSIQKEWNESVGAIILAPELVSEEKFSACPPVSSRQIISLDRLGEELSSPPVCSRSCCFVEIPFVCGLSGRADRLRGSCRHGPGFGGGDRHPEQVGGSGLFFSPATLKWPRRDWRGFIWNAERPGWFFLNLTTKSRNTFRTGIRSPFNSGILCWDSPLN